MITVKLYGLLRIESGIREQKLEADTVGQVLAALAGSGIPKKELDGCIIFVNGNGAGKRSRLKDGDMVMLMSPVAGG